MELHQFTLNVHLGWVNMSPYNFFFVFGPKITNFFTQRGRSCSWLNTFRICDTLICSGDIRDQSWKLSEIAPKFGRFFTLPNFMGRAFQKLYPFYHPCLAAHRVEKVLWGYTPTSPEVIRAHTLNFRPNFKFSGLNFLREPPSQLWCALASLGQSVTRVKIWGAAPPKGRNL